MSEVQEPVNNSPEADRAAAQAAAKRAKAGRDMIAVGEIPFAVRQEFPEAQERAQNLATSKDVNDAELSYLLFTLRESRGYLDLEYSSFQEYVEAEIGIGRSKASEMASTWEAFVQIGLPMTVLGGPNHLSWNKFKMVRPLIKSGYLTEASVYEWLPWLATSGPEALRMSDLETRVKRIVGAEKATEDNDGFTKLKMAIPNDKVDAFYNYQDVVRVGLGLDDTGMQCFRAMEMLASSIAGDTIETAKIGGLISLKRAAEHLVPGIQVVFLTSNPEHSFDKLGVPPIHSVYQGFSELNGKKELVFVLASSEEEAKSKLKTDSVRSFPITLADSLVGGKVSTETTEVSGETATPKPYADFDLIPSDHKKKIMKHMANALAEARILTKDALNNRIQEVRKETKTDKQATNAVAMWLQDLCITNGIDPHVNEESVS